MRKKIVLFFLIFLLVNLFMCFAQESAKPCAEKALKLLEQYDPIGYGAVNQPEGGVDSFFEYLDCSAPLFGIPTGVHETVHHYDAKLAYNDTCKIKTDLGGGAMMTEMCTYYYSPNGTILEVKIAYGQFYPREEVSKVADEDDKKLSRYSTYIENKELDAQTVKVLDISMLLDELSNCIISNT